MHNGADEFKEYILPVLRLARRHFLMNESERTPLGDALREGRAVRAAKELMILCPGLGLRDAKFVADSFVA